MLDVLATAARQEKGKKGADWKGGQCISIYKWHDSVRKILKINIDAQDIDPQTPPKKNWGW